MRVAVAIVNWNGARWLPECLRALAAQDQRPDRVIVVDNASTDGSLDEAARLFPFVEPIRLGANTGFAAASNVALRACAECEAVALLNPDAFPDPPWLSALLSAAERHPGHAAFASQLRSATHDAVLDGTGDVYHVSGLTWREGHGAPVPPPGESPREVFSACAAAALYRRDVLVDVGGFDEAYFCYHEDVDAGFRLRLRGHACLYVPDAGARHVGSASSGPRSEFATYHGHRNLVWTFFKNMPAPLLAAYLPQHLLVNAASLLRLGSRGQGGTALRAKRDALLGLPRVLRQRAGVQRGRRADASALRRAMARGWLGPYTGRMGTPRARGGEGAR